MKVRDIRQKKYVAVEDSKVHEIDPVNFFLQCVFFPTKNWNEKFWNASLALLMNHSLELFHEMLINIYFFNTN